MTLRIALFVLIFTQWAHASFRVASYNIRNFDYDIRSNTPTNKIHLVNTIEQMNPDIMAVQEINKVYKFEKMIDISFAGLYQTALSKCGGQHKQHLGFIYNTNKIKLIEFKEDLRTVLAKPLNRSSRAQSSAQELCNTGSRPLAIGIFKRIDTNQLIAAISVHLKSGGRKKSIEKRFRQHAIIEKLISELKNDGIDEVMVMGDFNSTEYILKNSNYTKFLNSVERMNLVNASKNLKCSSYWWGNIDDSTQYPSILDHILISRGLLKKSKSSLKVQSFGHCQALRCQATSEADMGIDFNEVSDHCPILTELK